MMTHDRITTKLFSPIITKQFSPNACLFFPLHKSEKFKKITSKKTFIHPILKYVIYPHYHIPILNEYIFKIKERNNKDFDYINLTYDFLFYFHRYYKFEMIESSIILYSWHMNIERVFKNRPQILEQIPDEPDVDLFYYSFIPENEIKEYCDKWINGEITAEEWRFNPTICPLTGSYNDYNLEDEDKFYYLKASRKTIISKMKELYNDTTKDFIIHLEEKYSSINDYNATKKQLQLFIDKQLNNNEMISHYNEFGLHHSQNLERYSIPYTLKIENIIKGMDDPKHVKEIIETDSYIPWVHLNINSPQCLSRFEAHLTYFGLISQKENLEEKYSMYFIFNHINKTKEYEAYEILKDIFYLIKHHCPNNTWRDFKSLFLKGGTSTKIEWDGDASVLNYIFRRLHKHLKFVGKKWEVISFYFNPNKKETLLPKNLEGNSHYYDEDIEKKINQLISTLSQRK
jgi:hypothetical protein